MRRTLVLTAVGALAVMAAGGASAHGAPRIVRSCPFAVNGRVAVSAVVNDVIAAARHVEVEHVMTHFQGRSELRSDVNTPVVAVVDLGPQAPVLPGEPPLTRLAGKRCGSEVARYSWAVVFHDGLNVICCIDPVVFVTPTKSAWYVF
jgi:hypothetical protein